MLFYLYALLFLQAVGLPDAKALQHRQTQISSLPEIPTSSTQPLIHLPFYHIYHYTCSNCSCCPFPSAVDALGT